MVLGFRGSYEEIVERYKRLTIDIANVVCYSFVTSKGVISQKEYLFLMQLLMDSVEDDI